MDFRNIITKEQQAKIINEVFKMSRHNVKIWLAIKWLATYIAIRPSELCEIKEKHIQRKNGLLIIPHPKEKKPKIITLIEEDIEILKFIPEKNPDDYFFTHTRNNNKAHIGEPLLADLLYRYWKRA